MAIMRVLTAESGASAPPVIGQLVEKFTEHRETYRRTGYNETQLRQDFQMTSTDLVTLSSALLGAIIGAVIGSVATWYVSRRLAFLERSQAQIQRACEELQHYRVVYAQYFAEYLSDHAKRAGRDWTNISGTTPDAQRVELEGKVDASRGRLRVHQAILKRILLGPEMVTADLLISEILQVSSHVHQADPHVVDRHSDSATNALVAALPRH